MTPHAHTWSLLNSALRRYRCTDCGVIGHACRGRRGIVPFACQHELARNAGDRTHCGKPAVYVTALRAQTRCADHAPPEHTIHRAIEHAHS